MPRPKKRKIEEATAPCPDATGIGDDTGITGPEQPAPELASPAKKPDASASPVRSAAAQKKLTAAMAAFEEAMKEAMALRAIATEQEAKEKLAERLYDAKMARLEAGDKRNRRKSTFRAAKRTYEAMIELLQAQHKCAWMRAAAAEAETAAAKAELRWVELL